VQGPFQGAPAWRACFEDLFVCPEMNRNRPTTALTWLLLVTLVVNSTTAPAIAHTHSDWEISGNHHFGGHGQAKHDHATDNHRSASRSTAHRSTTGHVCDHGHRHHRGGLHTHSMRADRMAAVKLDRDRVSSSLAAESVVRHWHVSWLALEFTIPAPPERSDDSDRDLNSAPSVVRLYDHTSPIVRADVGRKIDDAACAASLVAGYFEGAAFGDSDSPSASPPLLCGIARTQRLGVLRI
jgi:hypothetical protein